MCCDTPLFIIAAYPHQAQHGCWDVHLKALMPEVGEILGLSMRPSPHGQQPLSLEEGQVVGVHGLMQPMAHPQDHLRTHRVQHVSQKKSLELKH